MEAFCTGLPLESVWQMANPGPSGKSLSNSVRMCVCGSSVNCRFCAEVDALRVEQGVELYLLAVQRLRDNIKTWLASSDIKDKKAMQDAKKLIEMVCCFAVFTAFGLIVADTWTIKAARTIVNVL